MTCKILGISGSPVKQGNVETFLTRAVRGLPGKDIQADIIHLSGLKIQDCLHCNFCLTKQKEGKYCSIKDDAQEIFEKAEQADILVLATPVYFMRPSARMAAMVDRLRVFIFGNLTAGRMRNKIGVSMAVSWLRHGGLELTHMANITTFLTLEMIPASIHKGASPLGASAVAGPDGELLQHVRLGIESDEAGLQSARLLMRRAVELARRMARK